MTVTATPATVGPRMGMIGGVLRPRTDSPGARLHTDRDLDPTTQRIVLAAEAAADSAQTLANTALLDLAVTQAEVKEVRQLLLDMTVQRDAMRAELVAARPVLEMAGLVAHGARGVEDMRQAWIRHEEEGR